MGVGVGFGECMHVRVATGRTTVWYRAREGVSAEVSVRVSTGMSAGMSAGVRVSVRIMVSVGVRMRVSACMHARMGGQTIAARLPRIFRRVALTLSPSGF